jgi:glycosyltransferase involved in cell wall biosynthesis
MEALGVEHIHAHWATHPTLAAYVASHLTGIGYSFTGHAHDLYVDRTMLQEKIERARFVVTISEYNRRLLTSLYGRRVRDKLAVIHCGTDPAIFAPPPSPRTTPNSWVLLCVASLQPQKGHVYLIEACRQLRNEGLALQCLLIGEGAQRAALERQISEAGLSGAVTLMGSQPRHRVVELLAASDVVVQPSITLANGKTEGIPVALMEALSMERPVVATGVSGIPELIRHGVTGLLVPEGDSGALAAAVRTIHDDRALAAALGRAGRKLVVEEFNLHTSAQRLEALFAAASHHA